MCNFLYSTKYEEQNQTAANSKACKIYINIEYFVEDRLQNNIISVTRDKITVRIGISDLQNQTGDTHSQCVVQKGNGGPLF